MKRMVRSIIPPSVPMWAVFYDDSEDGIHLEPIIALALVDNYEGYQFLVPIQFSKHPIEFGAEEDWVEYPHFCPMDEPCPLLGYTLTCDLHRVRDDFQYRIATYQRAVKECYGPK